MDNKFDRITREPLVMGGQARIRDTNITVNEVVRLSVDGTSQTNILAKYPELEAEDIHQVLSFAIHKNIARDYEIYIELACEMRTPLTVIDGFANIILHKYEKEGILDTSYLNIIPKNVELAKNIIENVINSLNINEQD